MKFSEFKLTDSIFDAVDSMGFEDASPVQEKVIPIALEGNDLIACAQTGTGKTAAYLIPLMDRLSQQEHQKIKAIILAPTRELVLQIDQQFQGFAYFAGLESIAIYGGNNSAIWDQQRGAIEAGCHVLIASPGRLISHLNLGYVDLSDLEYLILDEADKMLDMGFLEDITRIVKYLPEERQTMMFSATMPPKIRTLAKQILKDPQEINIAISKPAEGILQAAYMAYDNQKNPLIELLLKEKDLERGIIFSSTKSKVKQLAKDLEKAGLNVRAIHSDLEQKEREEIMLDFRNKKYPILIATDIVSRGIDVDNIELVINYDVPQDPEDYVHRIGRTARAKSTGVALTLINKDDIFKFSRIEALIETDIFKIPNPESIGEGPAYNPEEFKNKKKGFNKRKPQGRSGAKGNYKKPFKKNKPSGDNKKAE